MEACLHRSGDALRSRDYQQAQLLAQQSYRQALQAGEWSLAARLLGNLGGAQFSLHQFRAALASYQEAHGLAERAQARALAAALTANIASLYSQLGESEAASEWLERSIPRLAGTEGAAYLPKVQGQLATVRMRQGRLADARRLFSEAIEAADRAGDLALATQLLNRMGEEFLYRGDLGLAETALLEAWRVRKLNHLPADAPYFNLGKLSLAQGNLAQAESILNHTVERTGALRGTLPAWDVYLQRGRLRLAQGRAAEALADLRTSLHLARAWRWAGPADDAARIGAEGTLQQVYSALVEAACLRYQEVGDPKLLEESFAAEDENRAASLRALLADPKGGDLRLPDSFRLAANRLQAAELDALLNPGAESDAAVRHARAEVVRMEAGAGAAAPVPGTHLLGAARAALDGDSVVFALHAGDAMSWLWAVDREGAALYRLPPAREINAAAERLSRAAREDSPDASSAGEAAFRLLFGQVDRNYRSKPRWLLALDGGLHDAPLGALVEGDAGGPRYLVQSHSLEMIPAVSMLFTPRREAAGAGFLGVGDAIYNAADPRRPQAQGMARWWPAFGPAAGRSSLDLPRLVSSAAEIDSCAGAWGGPATLLKGQAANRAELQAALRSNPAVVHVAAHVMQAGQNRGYGLLTLSLDPAGRAEVVAPYEIAHWQTKADLVVLSGCTSAAGSALPGTGVFGLTRAWLAAGARDVIASQWETPDDTGALFRALYRHLREWPPAGAAGALCRAQRDMIELGGWQSRPRYWGSYFAVGIAQASRVKPI